MLRFKQMIFVAACAACLWPPVTAPVALAGGLAFALLMGSPFGGAPSKLSGTLLKVAVVGLGFGLSLDVVVDTGLTGLWLTGAGVMAILAAGVALGRAFGIAGDTRFLVASGTAICGGSAIAAVAPVLQARQESISVAMASVFVLNALALYVFPLVGHALELDQAEFAIWAAVAIHDTSSVVGAASVFGADALEQATVLKLARALWIIPLTVGLAGWLHWKRADEEAAGGAIRWPWFIGLFVLAAAARTLMPQAESAFDAVSTAARQLMVLVLFLIGSGLSVAALRQVGWRPLAHAAVLWAGVSVAALGLVVSGWISLA